jgi:hypothetical protein
MNDMEVYKQVWCREVESIRTIFKGIAKIPSIVENCNADASLRVALRWAQKMCSGQLPVI